MSTEAVIAELLASKEPLRILVLGSEGDIKRLAALGLPVTSEDSSLSMQHLLNARLDAECWRGAGADRDAGDGAGDSCRVCADLCHACALPQGHQLSR